ncbi:MAG: LD-carboxypeptidase [Coriobacteriales bacterium]|jgi:muramoyltetrapeptide carboxypeptidase LdcA involved in peptidoglycan recycling|nr:LD-carboxypeptidase [Coriobacteriales bacterium]
MKDLIKPVHLKAGDLVATVSPSSGVAGDPGVRLRYDLAVRRLQEVFGLRVKAMLHCLDGSDYLYHHPEARAADLMEAFADPEVKGVFSCLGGEDTMRLLPFIDYQVIHDHPKVFLGYSDTTANHFMCLKAGLTSFYGPSVLVDFAEGGGLRPYMVEYLRRAIFSDQAIGLVEPAPDWSCQQQPWDAEHFNQPRHFQAGHDYQLLQGQGVVEGPLIGGNLEVLDWMRGTEIFPDLADFAGAIVFLESSFAVTPEIVRYALRCLGLLGVWDQVAGIIVGKPLEQGYAEAYKTEYLQTLAEFGRSDLPILYDLNFGHCDPRITIPYGAIGQIDCETQNFAILSAGCV